MLFFCLALLVSPCLSADIVDTLVGEPKASTLVQMVTKAGLVDTLKQGTFTVFAPTDAAFNRVPADTLNALLTDNTALGNLLKYHVVTGAVESSDIRNEEKVATVAGGKVRFNVYTHNKVVTINGVKIITVDIKCDNGYIHLIDDVIMPPTHSIVELISEDPELSTLLSVVTAAGIANEFQVDPMTLFAPTNDAFAKIDAASLAKLTGDAARLKDTLEYHGVPHSLYSQGIWNNEFPKSIDGHEDRLRVRVNADGVKINTAKVIETDLKATNGVVHKIDHVLIPIRVGFWLGTGIGKK